MSITPANPFTPTTPATGYGTCESCGATCIKVSCIEGRWVCDSTRCNPLPKAPLFDLTEVAHVTASVVTANSTYVVVARPRYGVRVVCPSGEVLEGTHVHMVGGHLFLRDNDGDRTLLRTSTVVAVHVHEN